MISRPVLELSFKSLSNGVIPLLSCLGSPPQSVERSSKSFNSNEKTALKLQVRASSPKIMVRHFKIAVRNFCISYQSEPESKSHNCGPQFLSKSVFHLISSCRFDPSRSKPHFSLTSLFSFHNLQNNKKCSSISNST
jgi:sulfatase maturation enzyme AslB (radical SAM superfamily)